LIPVRKGDVATVLVWCAQRWHATVEPLVWPGCWGYADRNVRGSTTVISNHSSGTAIDLNAPAHPRGVPAKQTMTPAKIAACRAIVNTSGGVLRWGGDYTAPSLPDAMHFEINADPNRVAAFANQIRTGQVGTTNTPGGDWFDMATKDDLAAVVNAAIDAKLGRTIWETTGSLPNRRGPGGTELKGGGADSLWGYSINADGFGYRVEQLLTQVAARVGAGNSAPPVLTPADRTAIATEVANLLAARLAQ
jgi:hypothetical protein